MNLEEEAPDQKKSAPPASKLATKPKSPEKEDLSMEIIEAVERRPGDRVKCTHISGSNYRVNWWSPSDTTGYDNPAMEGLLVTTHRVRQSKFLNVRKTAGGLVMTGPSSPRE